MVFLSLNIALSQGGLTLTAPSTLFPRVLLHKVKKTVYYSFPTKLQILRVNNLPKKHDHLLNELTNLLVNKKY
jgi:hypothetical protein